MSQAAPSPADHQEQPSGQVPGRWPGRLTTRLTAVVLGAQAPVVLFAAVGARALAATDDNPAAMTYLMLGLSIVLLCVVAASLTRWRLGIVLGWLAQLATFAYALVVPMMLVVGLIFGGLWVFCVVQGHRMDGPSAPDAARLPS